MLGFSVSAALVTDSVKGVSVCVEQDSVMGLSVARD